MTTATDTHRMTFDEQAAEQFLERIFPDGTGRIGLSCTAGESGVISESFDLVGKAVSWARQQDAAGPRGIYFRFTTLVAKDQMTGKRGIAVDSKALTMLVADLDFGTVGHRPSTNGLPHPATADEAMKLIVDLPTPTIIVHSGGGLYPLWLLDRPVHITDDNRTHVEAVSDRWQKIIEATGRRLGWHYGNVGDLPRLLRLPGSINRKTDDERPCRVIYDGGPVYQWAELEKITEQLTEPAAAPDPVTRLDDVDGFSWTVFNGPGPFDALDEHAEWIDVLRWERVPNPDSDTLEAFRRPGGTNGVSAKVLKANPHVLVVHSTDAGLPSGGKRKLTKGRVYAHLNYGDDLTAAASALRDGTAINLPAAVANAVATSTTLVGNTSPPAPDPSGTVERPAEEAAAELFTRLVTDEATRIRVREAARHLVDNEHRPPPTHYDTEFLTVDELEALPKLTPLIEGVLTRDTYALLQGRDIAFKTFIAVDWALCIATGKAWQGRPGQRAKVLYIAGEGAYGIADRVRAWETAWKTKVDPEWFTVRKSAVNLFRPGPDFDDLLERVVGYGFVVPDTLRRHSGGAEGNGSDMGVVVDNIDRIKRATDHGTILALAHTGKADLDTRGFSGIEDDADTVWHADRDGMRVELQCTKMKDGPDGFKIDLEMHRSADSLIVSAGSGAGGDQDGTAAQIIMQVMSGMFAVTGTTRKELVEATDLPSSTAYRMLESLVKAGRLRLVGAGSRWRVELP